MRILHLGWGFQPFRAGGLIEYAEDLMEIQVQKGYEVSYFCTGRFNVFKSKSYINKWKSKKGYQVYELWNPPVIGSFDDGVDAPVLDLIEPETEQHLIKLVNEIKPDIVHIQEFLGIPTSVVSIFKSMGIKTVFTVEDYYALCPTVKLVKTNGEICKIKDGSLGKQCEVCCINAPKNNIKYKLFKMYPFIFNKKTLEVYRDFKVFLGKPRTSQTVILDETTFDFKKVDEFNKRRRINLDTVKQIDLVIAMSNKVATIFNYYDEFNNLITLNLTLKHISELTTVSFKYQQGKKVTFGVINCMSTVLKGKKLMLDLFKIIDSNNFLKQNVHFQIFGYVSEQDKEILKGFTFVTSNGRFDVKNLNSILEDLNVNVGIVPSMWEEAYGYVGIEFLAKGIPVIGNNIGGIPDYVKDNETGWLNTNCSVEGIYGIINEIANNPEQVQALNQNIIQNKNKYIKTLDAHFSEMDSIYKNLLRSKEMVVN